VCYNPLLAQDRQRTRDQLLTVTEARLQKIAAQVARRTKTLMTAAEIGVKVGKIINHHKMGKHFMLTIKDSLFHFERNQKSIKTRVRSRWHLHNTYQRKSKSALSAEDTVRTYKSLGQVEQAFRCIKSIDLQVRPIRHRSEAHVRAHIFLCMLAYYVQWHMKKALSPVLFQDDDLDAARWTRNAVTKAEPSESVRAKKSTKTTPDGWPAHSFSSLLIDLATRCKNICRTGEGKTMIRFDQLTEATPFQKHVFDLLGIKP